MKTEELVEAKASAVNGAMLYQSSPIRVTVPASVAFHPDAFKESVINLMEKLGCGKCFSGWDCAFTLQRDYVINPDRQISALESLKPSGLPTVNVRLSEKVGFNINEIGNVLGKLSKKYGCLPCHSGFDFRFKNEIRELTAGQF